MSRFVAVDRDTAYLLPPSVDEWLPQDHLARFVVEVIDQLDLSALVRQYAGRGSDAYHPAMLLGLLVYGYATVVHSSRKIERACHDSVAFRFIAANTQPDHDSIATFRRRFLPQIEALFVQVLVLAREMKCLKLGNIALDGTKIAANASKHKALSWEHANRIEAQLRAEVQLLLKLAEDSDNRPVNDGLDVPAEIARRDKRLAAIAQAKTKIEQRARERHTVEQQEYEAKCAKRQDQRDEGKKPRGPDPQPPSSGPKAAVDTQAMLVVAPHVSQAPNDKREIAPILDKVRALPEGLGQVQALLGDTGYFSVANVNACEAQGIEPMLSMKRESHHIAVLQRFAEDAPAPETDDPVLKMAHRLATKKGRALYGLRKQTVEPVFGIIKRVMGWSQMSMRGLDKARGEWSLVTMAWNIKRLHVLRAA